MKIIYKKGNLIHATETIIAHGCNAQGKMKSGVAKDIRNAFPEAYDAYITHLELNKRTKADVLGSIAWAVHGYGLPGLEKVIANMITQRYYGRDPDMVYVDYDAIRSCMKRLNKKAKEFTVAPHCVAMPMIGAGLGRGDWDQIEAIIEEESTNFQPVVYQL